MLGWDECSPSPLMTGVSALVALAVMGRAWTTLVPAEHRPAAVDAILLFSTIRPTDTPKLRAGANLGSSQGDLLTAGKPTRLDSNFAGEVCLSWQSLTGTRAHVPRQ